MSAVMLRLPHEIERAIFQLAARVHPINHLPSYLLVAARVQHWYVLAVLPQPHSQADLEDA
jgi:hypothetical protein